MRSWHLVCSACDHEQRGDATASTCPKCGQPFLVEPNPDWPGVRVDIRDQRWQEVLLREELPPLIQGGYDGVMLDTIDTVPYLEAKDPARFAGSRVPRVRIVRPGASTPPA